MATFLNHVAIAAPRNGTTTHTVTPSSGTVVAGSLFTPIAGRLLVCVAVGAVTTFGSTAGTAPTGWTLPANGAAVNNVGVYVFYKTAAGSDTMVANHNGSNYPVVYHFIEFAAGSTFVGSAQATAVAYQGGAGPTLTGLTGTNWTIGVAGGPLDGATPSGSVTWNAGTELADTFTAFATTEGYVYSSTFTADNAATSQSYAATFTNVTFGLVERLVFAVKAVDDVPPIDFDGRYLLESGTTDGYELEDGSGVLVSESALTITAGTVSAATPTASANLPGSLVVAGTVTASTLLPSASLPGTADSSSSGALTATAPKVASSVSGASITTGTFAASPPRATGSVSGVVITAASLTASLPRATSTIANTFVRTVVEENALTTGVAGRGTWFDGVTSEAIPGFARSTYYLPGQTAQFSINYNAAYTVSVWRFGHYQGNGARKVAEFAGTPTTQPAAVAIANSNGATTCAGWSSNVSWAVPVDATPGWYQILLSGANGTSFGHVLFCVSDKNAKRDVVIVASDSTWHCAYNYYGGKSLYGTTTTMWSPGERALCVTYDKPVITRDTHPQTHFFNTTYPYTKWSERMGYNAGHTTIEQINNDPSILDGRTTVIFAGHNEYIPQTVMDKTRALLNAGVTNIVNIAANDFFWRVTMGGTTFPTGATGASSGRVMWCKKDSLNGPDAIRTGGAGTAFTNQADWTGTWQDTRWTLKAGSDALLGDRFVANGVRADQVQVPFSMKTSPAWRNCPGVQALTSGQTYSFTAGSLGMEWDKPVTVTGGPVQVALTSSTVTLTAVAADINGAIYDQTETATHSVTMGRSSGGSHIANFNSDQWPWTLDALHLRGSVAADANAMQMMLNVLADLGVTADSASVTVASLTVPTPVSDIETSYALPAASTTGSVGGILPKATGSVSGSSLTTGSMAGLLPKATAAVTGTIITAGSMAPALPPTSSALAGTSITVGTLSTNTSKPTSSVTGQSITPGTLTAATPTTTSSLSGASLTVGTLAASAPTTAGSINGAGLLTGTLAGSTPLAASSVSGVLIPPTTGTVNGSTPKLTAFAAGVMVAPTTGVLAGSVPVVAGTLSGSLVVAGALSATTPSTTASLSGLIRNPITGAVSATLPRLRGSATTAIFRNIQITGVTEPVLAWQATEALSVWATTDAVTVWAATEGFLSWLTTEGAIRAWLLTEPAAPWLTAEPALSLTATEPTI